MFITLAGIGQKVEIKGESFIPTENFLSDLNAKLESCTVDGVFEKQSQSLAVGSGKIFCKISTKCFRCGDDVSLNLKFSFNQQFHSENNEDYYPLIGSRIELDQMIIDKILLSFPAKIYCKKNCLGRCDQCGKNLNEGKCDCDKSLDLIDPGNPFNALKKLKLDRRK